MEKEAAMNPIFTSCATSNFVAGMANKQLVDTSKPWRTQWRWIFFCEGTIHTNSTYVNGGKIYILHCTEIVFALKHRVVVVLHLIYCLLCTLESWLPPPFWRLWLRPLLAPCQLTHGSVKRHVQISQSWKNWNFAKLYRKTNWYLADTKRDTFSLPYSLLPSSLDLNCPCNSNVVSLFTQCSGWVLTALDAVWNVQIDGFVGAHEVNNYRSSMILTLGLPMFYQGEKQN